LKLRIEHLWSEVTWGVSMLDYIVF